MAAYDPPVQTEIGYAMQFLGKGESISDVQEKVKNRLAANGMNVGLVGSIINQALANLQAKELVLNAPLTQPYILTLPPSETQPGYIGIRVVLPVTFPDGHVETISVVVNVVPGSTPERAISEAERLARLHQVTRYGGRYAVGTVGKGEIVQVFAGGLQSGEFV